MKPQHPKLAAELTAIALAPWVLVRTWNWKTALIRSLSSAPTSWIPHITSRKAFESFFIIVRQGLRGSLGSYP